MQHKSNSHGNRGLHRHLADLVRLTHAQEVVLSCGTEVVAHLPRTAGPKHVIATQPFSAGAETYELNLYDTRRRELSDKECGAFQALTEALHHDLEGAPAVTSPQLSAGWVKDHVTAALDYVTDSFVLVLRDWTIQHVNTQFERTMNCRRADIIGRNLWEAFPGLVGTQLEAEARLTMPGTVPRFFEGYSEPLGRWFESRAFPCKEGLAILNIDISERKREAAARAEAEQKLLRSQRMEALGTLAGGIAHDFNNILGAVLGHVGLMEDVLPPRSPAMESLHQIRIAGQRARELVQQILAHSRSTTREFVRQPLRPLLEESLNLLRSTFPASARLSASLTEVPLAATVNPAEVQQLVMNLCTNALHALPAQGGDIRVELRRVHVSSAAPADVGRLEPGPYAVIVVADNGSGMTPQTRSRLFEPFFTTKPRGQGTGLGLHVVNGIVSAHGGAIIVKAEPGRGSTFEIYLPAKPTGELEPAPAPQPVQPRGRGERVAYVDDDEVVQLMVQRVLERAGFSVASFSEPWALLDTVRSEPRCFDLLVTDYNMPGMNGLQVAREVRSVCPEIPIIIATGLVSEELVEAVADLGHAEILNKERTFEELGERAAKAVASA